MIDKTQGTADTPLFLKNKHFSFICLRATCCLKRYTGKTRKWQNAPEIISILSKKEGIFLKVLKNANYQVI